MITNIKEYEFEEISKKRNDISIIESLLFVAGDPLAARDIARILECEIEYVLEIMKEIIDKYNSNKTRGIKLITLNGMYQLVTKPCNTEFVEKLLKKNIRQSLSQASLESLAIIAYKQPITRVEIDEIRGVKSDSALQKLVEKNLIEETGRLDMPGRPILYGTTDEFLRHFALKDINELPSIELFEEENQEIEKNKL